jgi:glycosyltransferase involved in cell wall biosynthesis
VVVPLYNKRNYILRCLESIQRQTMPDFEAIVVDDGSTDGGAEQARRIGDSRFRVLTQNNAGPGSARNHGAAEARGDIVAFLDADDEWAPNFLEAVIRLSQLYPSAGIYTTGYRRIMDTGCIRETTVHSAAASEHCLVRHYFHLALEGDFVTSSSVAIPKRVFFEAGGFLTGQRFGEDRDLWARIGIRYPIAVDRRILATYHSEAEGRSVHLYHSPPPYPPVVIRLKHMLAAGEVDGATAADVRRYIDDRLMRYALWLLARRDRAPLMRFLAEERFMSRRTRVRAALLKAMLRLAPMSLIDAMNTRAAAMEERLSLLTRGTSCKPTICARTVSPARNFTA